MSIWYDVLDRCGTGQCDGYTIDFDPATEYCKDDVAEIDKLINQLIDNGQWCGHSR